MTALVPRKCRRLSEFLLTQSDVLGRPGQTPDVRTSRLVSSPGCCLQGWFFQVLSLLIPGPVCPRRLCRDSSPDQGCTAKEWEREPSAGSQGWFGGEAFVASPSSGECSLVQEGRGQLCLVCGATIFRTSISTYPGDRISSLLALWSYTEDLQWLRFQHLQSFVTLTCRGHRVPEQFFVCL